ncbi:MAG: HDIG domain-containing protein [Bacillota bacterium]|jgi:putative nucleotidyltransferase with HDIG domain|nr:HDIG domain-containing protein [Bacillota bacterium]NLJ02824.1 HDIG domain-containing protein [Bacillota bacterium]
MKPTRQQAWQILTEYTKSEALLQHALAVEGVMRHFAELAGEDPEEWGVIGLLHDLDYEQFPDQHCHKTAEILAEKGVDEKLIRAVCSHGYGICTDIEPQSQLEKTLYTIDELTGLINAVCLMRPSRSVLDLEVKSVRKKFKQPSFAAGVNREVILKGCEMLGMDLNDIILETIAGMRKVAAEIGLQGNLQSQV